MSQQRKSTFLYKLKKQILLQIAMPRFVSDKPSIYKRLSLKRHAMRAKKAASGITPKAAQ
ncbi:hypothetical protein PAJ34TS1_28560 [Paenibacillus azoreducens]